MSVATNIVIIIVALLHLYFMVLEMFLWETLFGLGVFGQTAEKARVTKVLAANQGLYNGFLAAGLFWGLLRGTSGSAITIFFLCCIIIAGIFGAVTASRKILFIQAGPAAVGLVLTLLSTI